MENKNLNLKECTYEELCDLVNTGVITWSEWVEAQPELEEDYHEWLKRNGFDNNNEHALRYVSMIEEGDMNSEMSTVLNETITVVEKAREVLSRKGGA